MASAALQLAPYVSDTQYVTPPPLNEIEASLRDALTAWNVAVVAECLRTLTSGHDDGSSGGKAPWGPSISGGVVDVAIRARRRFLQRNGNETLQGASSPRPQQNSLNGRAAYSNVLLRPALLQPGEERESLCDSPQAPSMASSAPDDRSSLLTKFGDNLNRGWHSSGDNDNPLASSSNPPSLPQLVVSNASIVGPSGFSEGGSICGSLPAANSSYHRLLQPQLGASFPGEGIELASMRPASKTIDVYHEIDDEEAAEEADRAQSSLAVVASVLSFERLDTRYCGPAAVAVEEGDVESLQLVLRDYRFDVNTGCPLKLAIVLHREECFEILTRSHRVSPNRGAPLYYAVLHKNLKAVRALMEHSETLVNRYATGTSCTPLTAAIRMCQETAAGSDAAFVAPAIFASSSGTVMLRNTSAPSSEGLDTNVKDTARIAKENVSNIRAAGEALHYHAAGGGATSALMSTASSSCMTTDREASSSCSVSPKGQCDTKGRKQAQQRLTASAPTAELTGDLGTMLDIIRILINSPKVDVNKGFCMTPLQMAVHQRNTELVRLLLCRPNISPNRSIGLYPSPLEMSIEDDTPDVAKLLLGDPRVYVTEAMVNKLEELNNVPMLQLVTNNCSEMRMGMLWSLRCTFILITTILMWLVCICDIVFLFSSSANGQTATAAITLCLYIAGSAGVTILLAKRFASYSALSWYYGIPPLIPLAESMLLSHLWQWLFSDVRDLFVRERLFQTFSSVLLLRSLLAVAPMFLLRSALLVGSVRGERATLTVTGHQGSQVLSLCFYMFVFLGCMCGGALRIKNPTRGKGGRSGMRGYLSSLGDVL